MRVAASVWRDAKGSQTHSVKFLWYWPTYKSLNKVCWKYTSSAQFSYVQYHTITLLLVISCNPHKYLLCHHEHILALIKPIKGKQNPKTNYIGYLSCNRLSLHVLYYYWARESKGRKKEERSICAREVLSAHVVVPNCSRRQISACMGRLSLKWALRTDWLLN